MSEGARKMKVRCEGKFDLAVGFWKGPIVIFNAEERRLGSIGLEQSLAAPVNDPARIVALDQAVDFGHRSANIRILVMKHKPADVLEGNDSLDFFEGHTLGQGRSWVDQNGLVPVHNQVGMALEGVVI